MKTVVVGLSGGVDSSVTAYLLKKEGYRVIGLFMKNWHDDEECSSAKDYEDVQRVSHELEIPFYTVDFSKEYFDEVFAVCLAHYEQGDTPNPDILCNQKIKFHHFFKKALALGADYVATGHYARISSSFELLKGLDPEKDQSYFLYTLRKEILAKVLFPVGNLCKKEVRKIAEEASLATAKKKDSVGICFIGKRKFTPFLQGYLSQKPGPLQTLAGKEVGRHEGIAYYTIGQRKGLGIGGEGEAWFVVGKDKEKNIVFVEQGEHASLYHFMLLADEVSWVGEEPSFPLHCTAKIRYRTEESVCTVRKKKDQLLVTFLEPQKAITPQQAIVFYQQELCLGGATIISALRE